MNEIPVAKTDKFILWIGRLSNLFEIVGILGILILASVFQVVFREIPCPLCLLQRIGFVGIAFGFLLNLKFGFRPSHYAIVILSGIYTSFVALRQIALHVVPGTGAYGDPIFGFHLYTWAFIIAMMIVIMTSLLLLADRDFNASKPVSSHWTKITHILFAATTLIIILNIISVILECGFNTCPDNPTTYELLHRSL